LVKLVTIISLCPKSLVPSTIRDLTKKINNIKEDLAKATQLKTQF